MFNGEIILWPEPQEIEVFDLSSRGVILIDYLGKKEVFVPKVRTRKERARYRNGKPFRSWARNFMVGARGRVSVHTFFRENGTTTIFPASENLMRILLKR